VDPTPVANAFAEIPGFELTPRVLAAMAKDGISVPTEAQRAAIAPILEGRHVVIESGTGTGKTLAYLLPLLQRLQRQPEARAAIFTPATELAIQTLRVAERYKEPDLKSVALVASGNQRQQATRLEKSTRLIVGTVGRLLEMYERRKLKGVGLVVLDEPEPILSTREADYLFEVLSRPDPKLQLVLAGATFGRNSERLIDELMGPEVVRTRVAADPLRSQIAHQVVRVRNEAEKDVVLARFLTNKRCERAVVFVNQPNLLRHLYRYLTDLGYPTVSVSVERTKLQREQAIRAFQSGQAALLLTHDQAATGLDLQDVPWVLHFELPTSAPAYVHRAGRTGRAGATGHSVLFATQADRPTLARLERELGLTFRVLG